MTTLTAPPTTVAAATRTIAGWRQFGLLVQWQVRRTTPVLPMLVVIQVLFSVATIAGYGLLVGHPSRVAGLYLATGAPTVGLITLGVSMTPQWVSQARTEGSLDWLRTLPIPRELYLFADLLVWTLIALPGLVLGIVAGSIRFDADLTPTWWLVPVALVVALTSASIGYAMACLLPATIAQLIAQVMIFLVLLFTPISFPADRMPTWAQDIHRWLPLQPMAEVMRASLAPHEFSVPGRSWVVLLTWCVASVGAAAWSLRRRG